MDGIPQKHVISPQSSTAIETEKPNPHIHEPVQLNIVKDPHLQLFPFPDFAVPRIEESKIDEGHWVPVQRPENGSAFMGRSRKRNDLIIAKKPGNCVSCWKVEREVTLFSSSAKYSVTFLIMAPGVNFV
jgi:hypothetical protein